MYRLNALLSEQFINALGWTIIHSIWQGLLMALILFFLLGLLKSKPAKLKHLIANYSLLLTFLITAATFCFLYEKAEPIVIEQSNQIIFVYQPIDWVAISKVESSSWSIITQAIVSFVEQNILLIVMFWLTGALVFSVRLIFGVSYINRIKRTAFLPDSDHWQEMLNEMVDTLGMSKSVELLESSLVKVPLTIGVIKPLIIFPVGVLNHLTLEQAESIMAHELAHVFRKDYLWNLIQSVIETLLYFNPGVWWISYIIRKERENSCDDMAMQLCGSSIVYAKALVHLQEWEMSKPQLAMGLASNKNLLLNRIKRILKQPHKNSSIMEKVIASCFLCCFIFYFSMGADHERTNDLADIPVSEPVISESIESAQDTFPKDKVTLSVTRNDSTINTQLKNGEINYLIINGEEVPEEKLDQYTEMIDDLVDRFSTEPVLSVLPSLDSLHGRAFSISSPEGFEHIAILEDDINGQINLWNGANAHSIFPNEDKVMTLYDKKGKVVARIELDNEEDEDEIEIIGDDEKILIIDGDTLVTGFHSVVKQSRGNAFAFAPGAYSFSAPQAHGFSAPDIFMKSDSNRFNYFFSNEDFPTKSNGFFFRKKGEADEEVLYFNGNNFQFDFDSADSAFQFRMDTFPLKSFGDNFEDGELLFYDVNDSIKAIRLRKLERLYKEISDRNQERMELNQRILEESIAKTKEYREREVEKLEKIRELYEERRLDGLTTRDSLMAETWARVESRRGPVNSFNLTNIGEQLVKDNLVKEGEQFTLELTADGIKINGSSIDKNAYYQGRYTAYFERFLGTNLKEGANVYMEKTTDGEYNFRFNQ